MLFTINASPPQLLCFHLWWAFVHRQAVSRNRLPRVFLLSGSYNPHLDSHPYGTPSPLPYCRILTLITTDCCVRIKASSLFKQIAVISSLTAYTFKIHAKKIGITKEKCQTSSTGGNLKIPLSQQITQTKHQRRYKPNTSSYADLHLTSNTDFLFKNIWISEDLPYGRLTVLKGECPEKS